jgi:hypothetical protein
MKHNLIKMLVAISLCVASIVTVQAQSLQIRYNGTPVSGYHCMSVNDLGTTFSVNQSDLVRPGVSIDKVDYTWTVLGGIQIQSESGTTVSVAPTTGTTYATQYSKYAKGKLNIRALVTYKYEVDVTVCTGGYPHDSTITFSFNAEYNASIEIRKEFDMPDGLTTNAIVGPVCISPGDSVTYSVAPWVSLYQMNQVGFDSYDWTIPQGLSASDLYYSADSSSVTFTAGTDIAGKTLSVTMGKCNTSQTPISLTLNAEPEIPELEDENGNPISWETGYCLPLNAGASQIVITNYDSNLTYTWTKTAGWQGVSQVGGTLYFTPSTDARELRLTVSGPCTDKVYDLQVNRSFATENNHNKIVPVINQVCFMSGEEVYFKVDNAADGMPMQWSISEADQLNGWEIISGANTAQPKIKIGTVAGTLSVVAGCGNAIEGTFDVKPNVPAIIESAKCLENGDLSGQTFTVTADNNATSYQWDFPATWEPTNPASRVTTSPAITINTDGTTAGTIKVKAIGCAESGWSQPVSIKFNPVKPTIAQEGCLDAGLPGVTYFRVTNHKEGQAYDWTIDPLLGEQDFTYTPPVNDPSKIKVTTLGNVGTGFEVTATASNSCGTSTVSDVYDVDVVNPFWATNETSGSGLGMQRVLSIDGDLPIDTDFDNIYIAWYINGDLYSEDYALFGISFSNRTIPNGYAEAIITYEGCTYKVETSWGNALRSAKSASTGVIEEDSNLAFDIIVTPNPAKERITVILPEVSNGSVFLLGLDGKLLKRELANALEIEFNVSDIPNGTYIVSAAQNGKRYSKQIVIKK